ncbi:MAG: cysteine desulfurase [Bacteroidales bacterium]|nr:MAG: cysteine desulfurase [Bacteroidales bacterium]
MNFDVDKIRGDFPILKKTVNNYPLVYLDNAATTQKPKIVIDKIRHLYSQQNSSIHRGVHWLSEQITENYEEARRAVKEFINARSDHEVIFTSGATGSINAIAFSFGEKFLNHNDEVIVSAMEHHANIVPWQMLCERKGASLKIIPINDKGELVMESLDDMLTSRTRLIALTQVSNSLGTVNPVEEIIEMAHGRDIPVLIDGAQSIQHGIVDVRMMDCDFFVFSGHKIYGPNGIGVLYGKEKWLEELPPYQGGGDMVDTVTFEKTTFNRLPFKFEAGTTNYTGAIALATALNYIEKTGREKIADYESGLHEYAASRLNEIGGIKIYGTAKNKISIISFLIEGIHPYDAGMILDKMGIAVRTGTHCAQPVMDRFEIDGTIRASMAFYNTRSEIDRMVEGIEKVKQMFG